MSTALLEHISEHAIENGELVESKEYSDALDKIGCAQSKKKCVT